MEFSEFRQLLEQIRSVSCVRFPADEFEKHVNSYWNCCKNFPHAELYRALVFFYEEGIWPRVKDLKKECGIIPMQSREQQQQSLERDQALPKTEPTAEVAPQYETEYGEWQFCAIGTREINELEANLKSNGWNILETRPYDIVIEEKLGRNVKQTRTKKVCFLARRRRQGNSESPERGHSPNSILGRTAARIAEKLREREHAANP
jgi:hypothetical protein